MFSQAISTLTVALLSLSLASTAVAAPSFLTERQEPTPGLSLTAQLTLADSFADRYNLLSKDSDFVYNFNAPDASAFATRKTFPALVGTGFGLAYAIMPACSYAPLHIHPRANELLIITSGKVTNYMVPEFGVSTSTTLSRRVITNIVEAGQATLNPMGALHTIYNYDCEPASAAASFSSEDPGINPIASSFFALPDEQIEQELGGEVQVEQIEAVRAFIMEGNLRIEECKKTCGNGTAARR